ncbi:MAG: MFS transporter [Hyphomicrobium sp.]
MQEGSAAARTFATRLSVFYGALFVVYGMHVPFTPMWLDWRGLTSSEIGTVMAAPFFVRLFLTPVVALAADRAGDHRRYLIALAGLSLALTLILSQAESFVFILVWTVMLVISNATIMPLTETVAVEGVRRAGLDYGRMRLWGSLTFVAASFIGGVVISHTGAGAGMWLVASGAALTLAAAFLLPDRAVAPRAGGAPLWHAREPRRLLASRPFVMFLLAAGTVQAAHATFLTFGTLIWHGQGLSSTIGGLLWAIGVFAEVALFSVSKPVIARFGPAALLIAGAGVSVVRWAVMAFDPPLAVLVPLQILHGVTYGATHLAAIHFVHQALPLTVSGSGQALYATVAAGLAMGLATLIAGQVFAAFGSGAAYAAMGALALLSLAAALRLNAIWDGNRIFEDEPLAAPPIGAAQV